MALTMADFLKEGERIHARHVAPLPTMTRAQALAAIDALMERLDPEAAATIGTIRAYIAGRA